MNTILNKFVATLVAVALCLAFAIIASPLAHAENDTPPSLREESVATDEATQDTFNDEIATSATQALGDEKSTPQNNPVGLPDGSQGGAFRVMFPKIIRVSTPTQVTFPKKPMFTHSQPA